MKQDEYREFMVARIGQDKLFCLEGLKLSVTKKSENELEELYNEILIIRNNMKKERVYTTANQTTIDELNEETLRSVRLNIIKSDEKGYYREVAEKADKKDCTCFNCDKCAEQMRAYYERTGELKPGNVTKGPVKNNTGGGKIKETISADYKVRLFHECGIKFEDWETTIPRTEEKKPSDRIDEIYRKIEPMFSDRRIAMIAAIGDYLDECWEKGRNE